MKIFQLNWSHQNDNTNYLFMHGSSDKTVADFKNDCKNVITKYGREYLNQEKAWAGYGKWIEFAIKKMTEIGYVQLNPERITLYGTNTIDESILEDVHTNLDNEMSTIVGGELNEMAIKHNKDLRSYWDVQNINRSKVLYNN